ncbi:tRNA preQ1(34) S-adenosylmethionine ribosyltransferase-isomerase QueA [Alkalibaculum sp. M08DMB]|uniref:S-adenosylmethionine:tRNA ribosyltransferase-isomerase n=1 Tax=Alkalibaculum sporogenes TaxID=2655001 RepID=A0A6A7K5D4_9FIRM|nr:tRNA preQ1(34) S-adenosylmethionine ribosyltransferase-isomerase QueA [Alkalibaculum sporogenes]MPW24554.1 tRNA preQ1(34) S-adenosylmethionine ribosyltransferase-isomerase QueA [Alkalibaculum sporogenes]
MNTKDFDYDLPDELIAQRPFKDRDTSRLMVLDQHTGEIEHKHFYNILDYLDKGDTLVLNNTRVMPARLFGKRVETGAVIEILLLKSVEGNVWETLVKPGKKAKVGVEIKFSEKLTGTIIKIKEDGNRLIDFKYTGIFEEILDELGLMPLPPYIKEKLDDKDRYQTVYSKVKGSAAAPTAGLHFTEKLLEKISDKGVNITFVTLHVGLGTFRPVKVDDVLEHKMHEEYYTISQETVDIINETKKKGKKIIAVGTTSVRTLETAAKKNNTITASSGWTDIFIYPGFEFKIVDKLITNFHLPQSTLMMLICAFASKKNIMDAYQEAIDEQYRFFSFGDAMLIE